MDQLFFLFPYLVECAAAVNWEAPRRSVPGEVASWAGKIPVQFKTTPEFPTTILPAICRRSGAHPPRPFPDSRNLPSGRTARSRDRP